MFWRWRILWDYFMGGPVCDHLVVTHFQLKREAACQQFLYPISVRLF